MPFRSSIGGFALPISRPLYICLESTDIISPLSSCAKLTERAVFPDALGPAIAISFGFVIIVF